MKFRAFIFCFAFIFCGFSQKENDKLVKSFVQALVKRDKDSLKKMITYVNENEFRFLWDFPKYSSKEEIILLTELAKLKIKWLEIGELINLSKGGSLIVNENMVNEKHQLALVELRGYGTPIQLRKQGDAWKVTPHLIIVNNRLRSNQQIKVQIKKYNLIIGDQKFVLNEEEELNVILDGKNYKVVLQNNDVIAYKGVVFDTVYHKDFHKFSRFEDGQEILSLIANNSLRSLIRSYNRDIEDSEVYKQVLKLMDAIYLQSNFKEQEQKEVSRYITGKLLKGKRYITEIDEGIFYDEVFIVKFQQYKILIFLHASFQNLSLFEKYFEATLENLREIKNEK